MACQLWCSAPDAGVKFSTYIGDDDSTTLADIHSKVPYGVEKWTDIIHAKRSLTTCLYNLKDRFKNPNCSILSSKVINYFSKCFSYAISQNVGEPENLRTNLKCIVPHAFGNNAICDISRCGFKKSPATYKHSDLPNGKDSQGEPLQRALNEYTTDVVMSKRSPGANSQRNECLNSIIASKNPKTRFYGGSESNDFRDACAVAQKNIGYNYVSRVHMAPWPPAVYCSSSAILAIVLLYAGILLFVLFMATLNDIKKLLEEEIRPIRSKLLSIEEKFSELKSSVDYFSGKYDELLKIQSSNDKTGKLTADVRIVKQDLSITQKRSVEAKKEIDELAQYLRRDCVEISGLKPNDEVDCFELVKTIGKEMGMDLGDEDISTAHPLPTFNQATDSKLIVKFTRRAVRD